MPTPRPQVRDELPGGGPMFASRLPGSACATPQRASVSHAHAALGLCLAGRARVEQQGQWTQAAGDVRLVPAGCAHRALEQERPELWAVGFSAPCVAAAGDASLLAPFERVRAGASPIVRVPAARQAFLASLLGELCDATRPDRAAPFAVQHSLLTLVLHEVRAAEAPPSGVARAGVVADSLQFIERNCLRPLTLLEVADAVGRSPAYVTGALTRATGRSAVAWIIAGRLAEARRRLLHADEPIEEVAERVGYADATHFIRMFRRAHGVTPAAWRARAQRAATAELTPAAR